MLRFIILLFPAIFLFACSNSNEGQQSKALKSRPEKISDAPAPKIAPAVLERGEGLYRKHCIACHQDDGNGIKGMFPPLSMTKTVNGDPEKLIGIVLNGLAGEIEVKGEIYNHVMIPHNFLSDSEVADLLTYVRNNFGNSSGRVSEEQVAALRN